MRVSCVRLRSTVLTHPFCRAVFLQQAALVLIGVPLLWVWGPLLSLGVRLLAFVRLSEMEGERDNAVERDGGLCRRTGGGECFQEEIYTD